MIYVPSGTGRPCSRGRCHAALAQNRRWGSIGSASPLWCVRWTAPQEKRWGKGPRRSSEPGVEESGRVAQAQIALLW